MLLLLLLFTYIYTKSEYCYVCTNKSRYLESQNKTSCDFFKLLSLNMLQCVN